MGSQGSRAFHNGLNPTFVSRLRLGERWDERNKLATEACPHTLRPELPFLQGPLWERMFRQLDAETVGVAAETRYPFVDLRLLRYMLAIPAIPWCRKNIWCVKLCGSAAGTGAASRQDAIEWRSAMGGGSPLWNARGFQPTSRLEPYVDPFRVPSRGESGCDKGFGQTCGRAPHDYWLRNLPMNEDVAAQNAGRCDLEILGAAS